MSLTNLNQAMLESEESLLIQINEKVRIIETMTKKLSHIRQELSEVRTKLQNICVHEKALEIDIYDTSYVCKKCGYIY